MSKFSLTFWGVEKNSISWERLPRPSGTSRSRMLPTIQVIWRAKYWNHKKEKRFSNWWKASCLFSKNPLACFKLSDPTGLFTFFEPQHQEISESYAVLKRRSTDFQALKSQAGRLGNLMFTSMLMCSNLLKRLDDMRHRNFANPWGTNTDPEDY